MKSAGLCMVEMVSEKMLAEEILSKEEGGQHTRDILKRSLPGKPLVSIITVVFNGATTLGDTIRSVLQQTYDNIEYIIIDGGSSDGTLDIIRECDGKLDYWLSERDAGIYDAMNKGVALASGEYVGMLNADDFLTSPQVIQKIVERLVVGELDAVFSQLDVVDQDNPLRVLRRYRVSRFDTFMLRIGVMPAHPTFYCRRSCYEKLGAAPYRTDYRIAADFELLTRMLLTQKISWSYLAETTVKMRAGGVSSGSYKARLLLNREIIRACRQNGLYTNMLLQLLKLPLRLLELIR
jgi:glycosyltransferase involved in cell wall biosynthesis